MFMAGKDTIDDYLWSTRRFVHDRILLNILVQCYENGNDAGRERAANAYKEYFQSDYEHFGQAVQLGLIGPPGHGKSSVFREASCLAAKLMGMEFIEENFESIPADLASKVGENTFFFSSMYMAGKQSPVAITGMQIPDPSAGLRTVLPEAYTIAAKAGASMIVFDDITAAPPQVQTALHMMFDDHVLSESLRKVYFAYTGNLGKLDKTAATDLMSSLSTRVELHYTRTSPVEYRKYLDENPKFNVSKFADAMITGFLEIQGADLFDSIDSIGNRLNKKYCAPRTMDLFIKSVRQELSREMSKPGGITTESRSRLVNLIQNLAQNTVGLGKSAALQSYYNSVLGDAYPIIQEILTTSSVSVETTKKCKEKFDNGISPEANSFRAAMWEAGSKFLGVKFANAFAEEAKSENKPQIKSCCVALNALVFGTIDEEGFRTTIVRKTMIHALRQLERALPLDQIRAHVGSFSPESGLVLAPYLSKFLSDDIAEKIKSNSNNTANLYRSNAKEIVLKSYEAFFKTNSRMHQDAETEMLNTKI
jgi:hypothetical protein